MTRQRDVWIAATAVTVLILLHLDFWRPQRVHLYLGWIPEELLYRLAYMVLAFGFMLFLCARVWRQEPAD